MQLSLELEYWTVDNTGALAPAKPVLDRIDSLHAESADPMLEVVTDPCDDVSQLREEVTTRLRAAIDVAREENRRLVPLGTLSTLARSVRVIAPERGSNDRSWESVSRTPRTAPGHTYTSTRSTVPKLTS